MYEMIFDEIFVKISTRSMFRKPSFSLSVPPSNWRISALKIAPRAVLYLVQFVIYGGVNPFGWG